MDFVELISIIVGELKDYQPETTADYIIAGGIIILLFAVIRYIIKSFKWAILAIIFGLLVYAAYAKLFEGFFS